MSTSDDADGHECPTCGRAFDTRKGLGLHHSQAHGESINDYERREKSGHECPTCDRDDFANEKGVKIHHKRAHRESIAGEEITCEWCGVTKRMPPSMADDRRFCSIKCMGEWRSEVFVGEKNPAWNGGTVTITCEWCGTEKERTQSQADRADFNFCGQECHNEWKRDGNMSGEDHPNWHDATFTCEWCGMEKQTTPSNAEKARFCSPKCKAEWQSENHVGEDNPAWNDSTYTCEWCGTEEQATPFRAKNARFCSTECRAEWMAAELVGPAHPKYKQKEIECVNCGDVDYRTPSQFERAENHFCSLGCRGEYRRESGAMAGENNPRWKGGISRLQGTYGPNWSEQREKARKRDNYQCQSCGIAEDEYLERRGRELDVNHIIPRSRFLKDNENVDWESANDVDNLVTLCQSCHLSKWEGIPLRPQLEADD